MTKFFNITWHLRINGDCIDNLHNIDYFMFMLKLDQVFNMM